MNTQPMTLTRFFSLPLVALGLAGLLVAGPLPEASATPLPSPDDPPTLVKHLRSELEAPDAEQRGRALVDVISLANCTSTCTVSLTSIEGKTLRIDNQTGTGRVVDLNGLTSTLLETYRRGPTDGHRLLALSALVSIGDQPALAKLVDEKESQSTRVRMATNRSLTAFYLQKYPELTKRTLKQNNLSIEDVRRAEARRGNRMEMETES